ncbi:uncharacterized protein LOC127727050 [Mytilus californianus]|uniref:uncharacterized protein LOC127727050 n=1 Tax=Mytilus californianus TaxID=6549 RepID=UPI0022485557|nr:uncharacterized protein LOC127727050 [Mytilus californianus]
MGAGASSNQTVGVTANPRVLYSDQLSKKEKKTQRIDVPVLIDVQHGSVRYRYGSYEGEPKNKSSRIERPFEGDLKVDKKNYFYHPRLNDFRKDADPSKEDDFKFLHVTKGPASCKNKKLFYVYGRGWNAIDGKKTLPTMTKEEGNDYSWPQMRKPNSCYYNLLFEQQETELPEMSEEERLSEELSSTPNKNQIHVTLTDTDSAQDVKRKIALKILKSAADIFIVCNKELLRNEDVIGDQRTDEQGNWKTFKVTLNLF